MNGFFAEIHQEELRSYLLEKADWHDKQAAELREYAQEARVEDQSINSAVIFHTRRAKEYRWLADHLAPGHTYRLSMDDLHVLEIVRSYR